MATTLRTQQELSDSGPDDARQGDAKGLPHFWIFMGVVVLTLAIHATTLTHSPAIWNDEVQILDYARVLFQQDADWSLTLDAKGRGGLLPNPVYFCVLRAAEQFFGESVVVTRSVAYGSAVLCVAAFWGLLRGLRVPAAMATLAALALWFDPIFVKSFRGARADAFAMGVAVAACWAWGASLDRRSGLLAAIGGGLAPLSMMVWPTASITLLPAIGMWVGHVRRERSAALPQIGMAVAGAGVVLLSYYVLYYAECGERISATLADSYYFGQFTTLWEVLRDAYKLSPWVLGWCLVAAACGMCRSTGLISGFSLVAGVAVITNSPMFHELRLVYALPAAYALIGQTIPARRGWLWAVGLTLCVPSAGVNVGVRVALGLADREARQYAPVAERLTEIIEDGAVVVTGPGGDSQHYYVGREHGWRMYFLNPEGPVSRVASFYILVKDDGPLPEWADAYDVELLDTIRTEPIKRPFGGREFSLYVTRVYRCTWRTDVAPDAIANESIESF